LIRLPLKGGFLLALLAIDRQGVQVQQTGNAGVGLFGGYDCDADQFRFVGEHRDETGVRDLYKVLVFFLPRLASCFQPSFLPMTRVPISSFTSRSITRLLVERIIEEVKIEEVREQEQHSK
jgi:hypothetical protein